MHVAGTQLDGLSDDRVHELDDRGLVGLVVHLADGERFLFGLLRLEHVTEPAQAGDQRTELLAGGDDRLHVERGHHRDVVDREHVGRIGCCEQKRLVIGEADRHDLVATRRVG